MKVLMHLSHKNYQVFGVRLGHFFSYFIISYLYVGFLLFASIREKQVCFDFHKQASSAQTGFSPSLFDFTVLPYLVVDDQT